MSVTFFTFTIHITIIVVVVVLVTAMRKRIMSGNDLAEEGWSAIGLEHEAYTTEYFGEMNIASIMEFVNKEVPGFRLVALSGSDEFDYALQETVKLEEYGHNDD